MDDIPLSAISAAQKHVYRSSKVDVPQCSRSFTGTFNDVPEKCYHLLIILVKFFPDTLLESTVHQTNLQSVQKSLKSAIQI